MIALYVVVTFPVDAVNVGVIVVAVHVKLVRVGAGGTDDTTGPYVLDDALTSTAFDAFMVKYTLLFDPML
jgi:hypothetical protein